MTETYGHVQWQNSSTCNTTNAWGAWVGIGGTNSASGLMQNGFYTYHDTTGIGTAPFWEEVTSTGDTNPVPVSFPSSVGDWFNISTSYSSAGTGLATFGWHDLTNNGIPYFVTVDHSASVYSGNSGEAIDERAIYTIGTTIFPSALREFAGNTDQWSYVQLSQNGGPLQGIRTIPHQGINMQDSTGLPLAQYGPEAPGDPPASSFVDTWLHCGTYGQ